MFQTTKVDDLAIQNLHLFGISSTFEYLNNGQPIQCFHKNRFLHTQLSARREVAHSQSILDGEVVLVNVWTATEVFGHRLGRVMSVRIFFVASFGPKNWRITEKH